MITIRVIICTYTVRFHVAHDIDSKNVQIPMPIKYFVRVIESGFFIEDGVQEKKRFQNITEMIIHQAASFIIRVYELIINNV